MRQTLTHLAGSGGEGAAWQQPKVLPRARDPPSLGWKRLPTHKGRTKAGERDGHRGALRAETFLGLAAAANIFCISTGRWASGRSRCVGGERNSQIDVS